MKKVIYAILIAALASNKRFKAHDETKKCLNLARLLAKEQKPSLITLLPPWRRLRP